MEKVSFVYKIVQRLSHQMKLPVDFQVGFPVEFQTNLQARFPVDFQVSSHKGIHSKVNDHRMFWPGLDNYNLIPPEQSYAEPSHRVVGILEVSHSKLIDRLLTFLELSEIFLNRWHHFPELILQYVNISLLSSGLVFPEVSCHKAILRHNCFSDGTIASSPRHN